MKRPAVLLAALAALLLTGLAATRVGRAEARPAAAEVNPLRDPAYRLFLQGRPRHWRACVLNGY
jgi:hypothetical protein